MGGKGGEGGGGWEVGGGLKNPKTSTRIRVETGTLCLLFLSSHIFTALEFSHIFTALEFDSKVFWYPSLPIG